MLRFRVIKWGAKVNQIGATNSAPKTPRKKTAPEAPKPCDATPETLRQKPRSQTPYALHTLNLKPQTPTPYTLDPAHYPLQTFTPKSTPETRNPHPENPLAPHLKSQTPQHKPPNAGGMREAREAVGATRAVSLLTMRALSPSLSRTHTHTRSLSLSLSLSVSHTHTHTYTRWVRRARSVPKIPNP